MTAKLTPDQIKDILVKHRAWRLGEPNGVRANLTDADLTGADLRDANLSGADLRDANLSGADLRDANLGDANLGGADLSDANLGDANLSGADLRDANLRDANLRGAYLRGAEIPVVASLHRATLAAIEAGGRLDMSTWHADGACGTTHCRAGWAVNLAGPAGLALEGQVGTAAAAALIIVSSCPHLQGKVPDFYATTRDALADIQRCAAIEAAAEGAQP